MKRKTWTKTATVAMALFLIAIPLLGACAQEVVKEEPPEPARSAPVLEPAPPAPKLEPAPPSLLITELTPDSGEQGKAIDISILGESFTEGATVTFSGTGISVTSVSFISNSEIMVSIAIDKDASPGPRDVTVTSLDGRKYNNITLKRGFTIGHVDQGKTTAEAELIIDVTPSPEKTSLTDYKVGGYLVIGEFSFSSVTYDAFRFGEQFVVWTNPKESSDNLSAAGKTEGKSVVPVENIRIISGLYIKDDSFAPIVIKWGQATTAMQPEAATKWLSEAMAFYSDLPSVSDFKVEKESELQVEGKKLLFAEVSFYEQRDDYQYSGLFATWYDDNSSNVLFLFAMGTSGTLDLFRTTALPEIVNLTDDLPSTPKEAKGGGDPLKGLNISCAKKGGCSSADGKTVTLPFGP